MSTPVQPAPGNAQEALQAMQRLHLLSLRRSMENQLRRPLTESELVALEESGSKCIHCGGYHVRACPRVKKIEFHPNNTIAAVEFWPPRDVDWSGVLFEDQGDPDDGALIRVEDLDEDISLLISMLLGKDGLVGIPNAMKRHPCRQYAIEAIRRIEMLIEVARTGGVDSPDADVSEGPGQG